MQVLDQVAESYVRLTLALGEIDPYHVDSYFGPEAWKQESKNVPLSQVIDGVAQARAKLHRDLLHSNPRARFLDKQLGALEARAKIRNGVQFSFDEESMAVYDVVAPSYPDDFYAKTVNTIDALVPGNGNLPERWEQYRTQFYIPPDRLADVFSAGVSLARERTREHIELPDHESFEVELVKDQPWGAYNWYKGGAHSLIQVNTDLPMMIDRIIHLACHEGYPGHHVYSALLERTMVVEKGWAEFSIYPLYSPESLIAEGTAEYGAGLCFDRTERLALEKEVLYPMAGLDPGRADELAQIQLAFEDLGNASNDAARRYLDGSRSRQETMDWLQTYALASPKRAEQNLRFFDAHRSYIVTYDVGELMVRNHVESKSDDHSGRWNVFTALLTAPTVPSDLT